MPDPHPFRVAAETKDLDLMRETLAEDVVLHSPILFKGFEGRDMAMIVLANVIEVFEDFRYLDEVHGDGTAVLRFAAGHPKNSVTSESIKPGGSTTWLDDFLSYNFSVAGTYYLEVTSWLLSSGLPQGVDYDLQVSLDQHAVAGFVFAPSPVLEDETVPTPTRVVAAALKLVGKS